MEQNCKSENKIMLIYPSLRGMVYFYQVPSGGLLIEAEVFGLPDRGSLDAPAFYAFHIHENGDCSKHFANTGDHYNPNAVREMIL